MWVDTPSVPPGRIISDEQTVEAATRMFHATADVDMDALAKQLCVSRATLYRVAGSRDRLLGNVLWRAGERVTRKALGAAEGTGLERLLQATARFNAEIVGYAPLRRLLRDDPATAFRVLFTAESAVHLRFVRLWCEVFTEAQRSGELSLSVPADELAFVFVRLGESMLYADLLSGMEPNLELAAKAQRAVLTSM